MESKREALHKASELTRETQQGRPVYSQGQNVPVNFCLVSQQRIMVAISSFWAFYTRTVPVYSPFSLLLSSYFLKMNVHVHTHTEMEAMGLNSYLNIKLSGSREIWSSFSSHARDDVKSAENAG